MKSSLLRIFFLCSYLSLQAQNDVSAKWKLVKVRDGQNLVEVHYKKTNFSISIKRKLFKGGVGCNEFKGKLEYVEGDSIRPILLVSTNMACPDYIDGLEYATITALGLCDKLVFTNDLAEFYNQKRLMVVLQKEREDQ